MPISRYKVSDTLLGNSSDPRQGAGVIGFKGRSVYDKLSDTLDVKDFGACGDGVHDDTHAIQRAIDTAKADGYSNVLLRGEFRITDTLTLTSQEFFGPSLIGENARSARLIYDTIDSKVPAVLLRGGSGGMAKMRVAGLTFTGSSASVGVEFDGQCDAIVEHCRFQTNDSAVWFHSATGGAFTEYCVARRCDFRNCTALEYSFETGAHASGSMHGSGMEKCTIGLDDGAVAVKIGADTHVYNAPMDARIWAPYRNTLITVDPDVHASPMCHGTLCVEGEWVTIASGADIYLGDVVSLGAIEAVTAHILDRTVMYGPSNKTGGGTNPLNGAIKRIDTTYKVAALTYESSPLTVFTVSDKMHILAVRITGANYAYNQLLAVAATGYGTLASTPVVMATTLAHNVAGWGAPAWSADASGNIILTNANYNGQNVSVSVYVTTLSLNYGEPW